MTDKQPGLFEQDGLELVKTTTVKPELEVAIDLHRPLTPETVPDCGRCRFFQRARTATVDGEQYEQGRCIVGGRPVNARTTGGRRVECGTLVVSSGMQCDSFEVSS